MPEEKTIRIAVDIGGTFVDAIKLDTETGQFELRKSATTPREPWVGVLNAIKGLDSSLLHVDSFIHGTTLGLNSGARGYILWLISRRCECECERVREFMLMRM